MLFNNISSVHYADINSVHFNDIKSVHSYTCLTHNYISTDKFLKYTYKTCKLQGLFNSLMISYI